MTPEDFIRESNRIEGIERDPTFDEIEEYREFMKYPQIYVKDMISFVAIYEPTARLREHIGMNVRVGNHIAPTGGPEIRVRLQNILEYADKHGPYKAHLAYEDLHPFTDCNGRSGRMLWLWQMRTAPLGFLHTFYYQTLGHGRD